MVGLSKIKVVVRLLCWGDIFLITTTFSKIRGGGALSKIRVRLFWRLALFTLDVIFYHDFVFDHTFSSISHFLSRQRFRRRATFYFYNQGHFQLFRTCTSKNPSKKSQGGNTPTPHPTPLKLSNKRK